MSVQAAEPAGVLSLPYERLLVPTGHPDHPALLRNLLDGLAEKALVLHDRNDCLIKSSVREKVLTYLSKESARTGSQVLRISMNREELAAYLNVDRSALSRELSRMQRDGLIAYHRSCFRLLER